MKCSFCGIERWDEHQREHVSMCCDCYDLSWGMSLEDVNTERKAAGRPLITREWGQP